MLWRVGVECAMRARHQPPRCLWLDPFSSCAPAIRSVSLRDGNPSGRRRPGPAPARREWSEVRGLARNQGGMRYALPARRRPSPCFDRGRHHFCAADGRHGIVDVERKQREAADVPVDRVAIHESTPARVARIICRRSCTDGDVPYDGAGVGSESVVVATRCRSARGCCRCQL